jgi:aquaporin Z
MNYLPLLYEFFGTFLLILSILASGNALVIGLTLALVVWLAAAVSGGHVNPAVSLAFFMKGALTLQELIGYVVVQLLGGVAALSTFQYIV